MTDAVVTVIAVLIVALTEWSAQMGAMWLLHRFVDLTLPEFAEWAWKVAAMLAISIVCDFVPVVGWVLGVAAYWHLMRRWFDAGFMAILYVGVARFAIGAWLGSTLIALIVAAL